MQIPSDLFIKRIDVNGLYNEIFDKGRMDGAYDGSNFMRRTKDTRGDWRMNEEGLVVN